MNATSVTSPTTRNATPAVPAPGNTQTRKNDAFNDSLNQAQQRLEAIKTNLAAQHAQKKSASTDSQSVEQQTSQSTDAKASQKAQKHDNDASTNAANGTVNKSNSARLKKDSKLTDNDPKDQGTDQSNSNEAAQTSVNADQTAQNKHEEQQKTDAAQTDTTAQNSSESDQTNAENSQQANAQTNAPVDVSQIQTPVVTATPIVYDASAKSSATHCHITAKTTNSVDDASSTNTNKTTGTDATQHKTGNSLSANLLASAIAGASGDATATSVSQIAKPTSSDAQTPVKAGDSTASADPTLSLLQPATTALHASLSDKLSNANTADAQSFSAQLSEKMNPTDTQENLGRVARGVQTALNQNGGSVTLRVNPPEMGLVRIQMQIESGVVRADLFAQHSEVSSMLKDDLNQLRQSLESRGLVVDRLQVQTLPSQPVTASQSQSNLQSAPDDGRSRGQLEQQQRDSSGRQPTPNQNGNTAETPDFIKEFLNMVA